MKVSDWAKEDDIGGVLTLKHLQHDSSAVACILLRRGRLSRRSPSQRVMAHSRLRARW